MRDTAGFTVVEQIIYRDEKAVLLDRNDLNEENRIPLDTEWPSHGSGDIQKV